MKVLKVVMLLAALSLTGYLVGCETSHTESDTPT